MSTTRTPATFTVPNDVDGIPAGTYAGYVEYMHVNMRGKTISQIGRCMMHITREEHPEVFSDKNAMVAIDYDVVSQVSKGLITYR